LWIQSGVVYNHLYGITKQTHHKKLQPLRQRLSVRHD
jgi:hypothetical protein